MMNIQRPGQGDGFADYTRNRKRHVKLGTATLNVGTTRGRAAEIVEMLSPGNVDTCSVQETRWKGE